MEHTHAYIGPETLWWGWQFLHLLLCWHRHRLLLLAAGVTKLLRGVL
jgi:hypothetical protein